MQCKYRKLTDLSNSNIKQRLTSSFVGLQPHRSRLEVKSENFEYVKCNTAASSNLISLSTIEQNYMP